MSLMFHAKDGYVRDQRGWGMLELCVSMLIFTLLAIPFYCLALRLMNQSHDHLAMSLATLQASNRLAMKGSNLENILLPSWNLDNQNLLNHLPLSVSYYNGSRICLAWESDRYICLGRDDEVSG